MKIEDAVKLEDCFDGSVIYSYRFDEAWTRDSIMKLKKMGDVDYFPDFPRPFFRLRGTGGFQVKGVEGDTVCRVILPKKGKEEIRQAFEQLCTAG